MERNGLLMVCMLVACASETTGGVSVQEQELLCGEWCDVATGCDDLFSDTLNCSLFCRSQLAQPCGVQVAAYQNCLMDLRCDDPLNDCEMQLEALNACRVSLDTRCSMCPQGTACYNDGCGAACELTGDCNYTQTEGSCRHQIDSGYCTDFAGCIEDGECPPGAGPQR